MLIQMGASGLLPAVFGNPQRVGKIVIAEWTLTRVQTLLLQPHAMGVQILESPRDSQGMKTIAPVVKNLTDGSGHHIAAEPMAAGGIEGGQAVHNSD